MPKLSRESRLFCNTKFYRDEKRIIREIDTVLKKWNIYSFEMMTLLLFKRIQRWQFDHPEKQFSRNESR